MKCVMNQRITRACDLVLVSLCSRSCDHGAMSSWCPTRRQTPGFFCGLTSRLLQINGLAESEGYSTEERPRQSWSSRYTGDAAIKASATLETPPEHLHHWGTWLPSHDFALSPAKQRAAVSRQVGRHAFETTGKIQCLTHLRTIQY